MHRLGGNSLALKKLDVINLRIADIFGDVFLCELSGMVNVNGQVQLSVTRQGFLSQGEGCYLEFPPPSEK